MPGSQDGKGSEARFFDVEGLTIDANGAVYAADTQNHTIRRIAPDGTVSTVLGSARLPGSTEPPSTFFQDNGRSVQIAGIAQVRFVEGSDSHGWRRPAQQNRAVFERDGQDVTTQVVVNPPRG